MPTYEYRCNECGYEFEKRQAMSDSPIEICPECGGPVRRLVSGGSGFILKGGQSRPSGHKSDCSLESTGRTCCGRDSRCGSPACEH